MKALVSNGCSACPARPAAQPEPRQPLPRLRQPRPFLTAKPVRTPEGQSYMKLLERSGGAAVSRSGIAAEKADASEALPPCSALVCGRLPGWRTAGEQVQLAWSSRPWRRC